VEAELKNCIYIDNICVVGNSYHNYLVALIVPNLLAITKLAKRLKIIDNSNNDLYENSEIVFAISKQIERFGKNAKLNKIEIPVKIKLCSEEWTPDNGLVTAAMKIKRKNIVKKYQTDIDSMYNSLDNN
jgi:long-chain acyl-CoA synthetase